MTEQPQDKQWGGRRKGAGRPPTDSKSFTFRVPGDVAHIIDSQENKTEFIKRCIIRSIQGGEASVNTLSWGNVYPATRLKEMHVPFFDVRIVAGFPLPLDNDERSQDIDLLKMLCANPEACYLIRVKGRSMIDAGIMDGDIVIVDKSNRTPSPSEVAVCELNGEYTLKRFERRGDTGWLIPANPDYPEIEITPNDSFSIWGTVTYIIHKPH